MLQWHKELGTVEIRSPSSLYDMHMFVLLRRRQNKIGLEMMGLDDSSSLHA